MLYCDHFHHFGQELKRKRSYCVSVHQFSTNVYPSSVTSFVSSSPNAAFRFLFIIREISVQHLSQPSGAFHVWHCSIDNVKTSLSSLLRLASPPTRLFTASSTSCISSILKEEEDLGRQQNCKVTWERWTTKYNLTFVKNFEGNCSYGILYCQAHRLTEPCLKTIGIC